MANKKLTQDFTKGNVSRQLIDFALPLYASNILQIVYNLVDMIIVGQSLGKIGLCDVANFLTFVSMGFSGAGQVIIAQLLGAKQREQLGRFIGNMITFLLICSIAFSSICLILREPILKIMNTPPESFEEALAYATVTISGLIFIYGYNTMSAILRGLGDSKHPFIFISISATLNIILDVLLVIVLNFGASGAALATVIAQAVSFSTCAIFIYLRREQLGFNLTIKDFLTADRELLGRLLKLGLPMAIKSASIHMSKLFVNSWINSYGVAVSAFAGIANKINSVANLMSNSLNTAGASMVGQNIGAEQYDRVTKIIKVIFKISMSIAAILSVVMLTFPEKIYSAFTEDAAVLQVGMEYLPIAVLIFFGSACRSPANALINGCGNYLANFMTALFDGIILRIGFSVLFGIYLEMNYLGFWLGDALAGFTPLVIGIILYISGRWKTKL